MCAVAMLAGCTGNTKKASESAASTAEEASSLKVGVGSVTSVENTPKEGEDTTAEFDTTVASVVLEGDVIKAVYFDVAQDKAKYDAMGHVTSDNTSAMTKKELGDDYGMKKASKIGKEWYEQIEALENWATGKTVDEVLGMKTNEKGGTEDEDLMTGCTIGVGSFQKALEKAANNAVEAKDVASVGTSVVTTFNNKDASADKSGQIQANTTYGVVAVDKDGKVVLTLTDVAQNAVKFTATGALDGEAEAVPTKFEKKDDYGMKKASKIGKEWYEQNQAFDDWTVGKTADEVSGMKVNDKGSTADEDLMTGCTIGVTGLQKVVVAAINSAKAVK